VTQADEILSPVQSFGTARVGDTFGPFLSPDGTRLAFAIRRGSKWSLVLDGVESQRWDSISNLNLDGPVAGFSPDGRHFTYVGVRAEKNFLVLDQKENPNAWLYCAAFSPDSRHAAFVRSIEEQNDWMRSSVVLDGKAGKEYRGEIEQLTFSPDGSRLAYKVRERLGGEYFVFHDGTEVDDYAAEAGIEFSPDSRHYAFLGRKSGMRLFVIDGQGYSKSDASGRDFHNDYFTFSPDSKRWAYISERDQKQYAIISGAEYGPYDILGAPDEEEYIYFSPDSRHFAFMATRDYYQTNFRGGRQFLVVDGHDYEIQGASWLTGSVLRFDSATKLHGLIMGKDRISRLELEIRGK
jgi:Tol biopolymer transport system component